LPSPILARADALMQRRRQSGSDSDDVPILTDAVDEDAPLHIDEAATSGEPPIGNEALPDALEIIDELPSPALEDQEYDLMARELACRVEQRIAAEMPRIIESAVQDFLAERALLAKRKTRG
jgi:hypothetical protein